MVTQADEVKAFIKSSRLWFHIKKLYLKTNMRVEYMFTISSLYIGVQKLLNQLCENLKSFLEISRKCRVI